MDTSTSSNVFGRSFSSIDSGHSDNSEQIIDTYRRLYGLPVFLHTYSVTRQLYHYCANRKFFVNMLVFHEPDHVFLSRSFGHEFGWQLPGSDVRRQDGEAFEDAVSRILTRDIPGIDLVELQPIATLKKTYRCEHDFVVHHGLTFIGLTRNMDETDVHSNYDVKGRFVSIYDDAEFQRLNAFEQGLLSIGRQHLRRRSPSQTLLLEREIKSTRSRLTVRTRLHDSIVKPLFRRFSSDILKSYILSIVPRDATVLDVACGDDTMVFELAKTSRLCVANDIEWKQLRTSSGHYANRPRNLMFFNHDARNLPFASRFDISLCKNVLHHMPTDEDLCKLLRSIRKVSNRILIIDPEDPHASKRGLLWNLYYRHILDDQGEKFLTRSDFEASVRRLFPHDTVKISYLKTIKGYFMIADITMSTYLEYGVKAMIFDLDGLLANTETLFLRALTNVLHIDGVKLDEDEYIAHDLQNGTSVLELLVQSGKIRGPLHDLETKVYAEYGGLLRHGVEPMEGAIEAIKRMAGIYPLAIASSSKRVFIDLILAHFGLSDSFAIIVGREDVERVKPDPECLELAARRLGYDPKECILVEDSQRGIVAGRRAGMRIIVVPNRMTSSGLDTTGVLVLKSLKELTQSCITQLTDKDSNGEDS